MNTPAQTDTDCTSSQAQALERLTVRRYLLGMFSQGIWWAGYLLFPFIMAKSLGASDWMVTIAVTLETSGMLLALYWGQLMARGGRRRWLLRGGLGGRVVLVLVFFVQTPLQFLLLLGVVYFFASLVYPAQNGILQSNICPERRGRIFGWGALIQHLTAAGTSLIVGYLLDRDPNLFRWIYPVLGLTGFVYLWVLARLPRPDGDTTVDSGGVFVVPKLPLGKVQWRRLLGATITPFREAVDTFREDRNYLWFETNFMIYGLAFMMLIPVLPLFFIQELDLSYKEISSSRVLISSLGVALLGPAMGRIMDRFHPVRLCTLSFAVIALYPITLAVGSVIHLDNPALIAYAAFGFFSLGMAGVNVTWNVGSISFAPPGQGGYYQGIHVAMVGVRGLLGPSLGFLVLKLMGYWEVFALSALVFLLSATSSALLGRQLGKSGPSS